MKNAIMHIFALVAMACALFVTPAMATEGVGINPIAVHVEIMQAIVAIDDRPMLAVQSVRSQPEAVAVMADKSAHAHGVSCLAKHPTGAAPSVTGPLEVGWRS